MINLLLLHNFYPVMSYRRVQKESDQLLYTVWSLVMVRKWISSAGMTCHARREFFVPKIAIFSQFQVYLSIIQAEQTINLLLLHNFYPVISYRRIQKDSDELLYRVLVTRYGPQSVAQVVRETLTSWAGMTRHVRRELFVPKLQYFLSFKYIIVYIWYIIVLSIFKCNPGKVNNKFITSQ